MILSIQYILLILILIIIIILIIYNTKLEFFDTRINSEDYSSTIDIINKHIDNSTEDSTLFSEVLKLKTFFKPNGEKITDPTETTLMNYFNMINNYNENISGNVNYLNFDKIKNGYKNIIDKVNTLITSIKTSSNISYIT